MRKTFLVMAFGILAMSAGAAETSADLATKLPGHYEGQEFGSPEHCTVDVKLVLGKIFRQPYLQFTISEEGRSMEYTAKVSNLEKTLRERHHGEDMAYQETEGGIFMLTDHTTDYVYFNFRDNQMQFISIDHTVSDWFLVKDHAGVDCGNLTKTPN